MAAKRIELLEAGIALRRKGKLEQEQTNVISEKGNAEMEAIRTLLPKCGRRSTSCFKSGKASLRGHIASPKQLRFLPSVWDY